MGSVQARAGAESVEIMDLVLSDDYTWLFLEVKVKIKLYDKDFYPQILAFIERKKKRGITQYATPRSSKIVTLKVKSELLPELLQLLNCGVTFPNKEIRLDIIEKGVLKNRKTHKVNVLDREQLANLSEAEITVIRYMLQFTDNANAQCITLPSSRSV